MTGSNQAPLILAESVQLLVVQPTPFCNIQCDYCYLPDRDSSAKLAPATFRLLLQKVFASNLVHGQLSLVWHAGEPLAMPVSYYRELWDVMDEMGIDQRKIRHSMQINGLLVNDKWCDFFLEKDIHIGVSLDGPAFLHESAPRRPSPEKGTHSRVLEGVRLLQRPGIDFHVIAVVTAGALGHADAIVDFFEDLGVRRLGLNVEELEGVHKASSLIQIGIDDRVRAFWHRIYERVKIGGGRVQIRELDQAYGAIAHGSEEFSAQRSMQISSQVAPLGIISMDWAGNISSFSPELLGLKSLEYGDFNFGNIHQCDFQDIFESEKFRRVTAAIYDGVRKCEEQCSYFVLCGGGAPSNKYFENGSFVSTETMYCRTAIQMPLDIMLEDLEGQLGLNQGERVARK